MNPAFSVFAGGGVIGLAVVAGAAGLADWSHVIVLTIAGLVLLLWPRRIFRADITRTAPDEVVIRFAPWYEGFVYAAILVSAVLGATMLVRELDDTSPSSGTKLIAAVFLLLLAPVLLLGCARVRRTCFLRITPGMLHSSVMFVRWVSATQNGVAPQSDRQLTRDEIEEIGAWTPGQTPADRRYKGLVDPHPPVDRRFVGLLFRPVPDGPAIRRDVGGPQLTVEPDNLLHALQAWKDADPAEPPTALMDRIEAILRGRPQTGPEHRHWAGGDGSGGKGVVGAVMVLGDAAAGIYSKNRST